MPVQDRTVLRKRLIALALKRARPGSGSHPSFLRERTSSYRGMDLRQLISRAPFVVVGAVATRLYMPERATVDVDVLIRPQDSAVVSADLQAAGAERIGDLAIGGSTWRLPDGTMLDVIESDKPWVQRALQSPQRGPDGLPYVDLAHLVLMKLQAGRTQDLADVSRMLGAADGPALERVRAVVSSYLSDASDDLESLIALGKLELQPL
jgi:hypothetical protein